MATVIRELLGVQGMELPLFCAGNSLVGFNLSGTWTGTASFYASFDGVTYMPLSVTPFASGANVQTATANGNWFAAVKNYFSVKVVFTTLTSGSLVVAIGTSLDASFQSVYLAASSKFANNASMANATNTLTIAASTNRAWRLRSLVISVSGAATWASSPALQIKDGATLLWGMDPPVGQGTWQVPIPAAESGGSTTSGGIVNTVGNALAVVVAAAGSGLITNINAEVVPA